MRMVGILLTIGIVLALVAGTQDVSGQCAMCRTALDGTDPAQTRLAEGFYYSILVLFAMPFSIVGFVGGMIYRAHRRRQRSLTLSA